MKNSLSKSLLTDNNRKNIVKSINASKIFSFNKGSDFSEGEFKIPFLVLDNNKVQDNLVFLQVKKNKVEKGWLFGDFNIIVITLENEYLMVNRIVLEKLVKKECASKEFIQSNNEIQHGKLISYSDGSIDAIIDLSQIEGDKLLFIII